MSGINLKSINENAFNDNTYFHLETLDLSNNQLKRFDSYLLASLVNLKCLNLSKNKYFSLEAENFKYNKNLEIIDLSDAAIQYVPSILFIQANSIRFINLDKNIKLQ